MKRAVEDAQQGDAQARKWLSDYLLPAVPQLYQLGGQVVMVNWDEPDSSDQRTTP